MSRQLCHGGRGQKKHRHKVFEEPAFLLAGGFMGLKCLQIVATSHIMIPPQALAKLAHWGFGGEAGSYIAYKLAPRELPRIDSKHQIMPDMEEQLRLLPSPSPHVQLTPDYIELIYAS